MREKHEKLWYFNGYPGCLCYLGSPVGLCNLPNTRTWYLLHLSSDPAESPLKRRIWAASLWLSAATCHSQGFMLPWQVSASDWSQLNLSTSSAAASETNRLQCSIGSHSPRRRPIRSRAGPAVVQWGARSELDWLARSVNRFCDVKRDIVGPN